MKLAHVRPITPADAAAIFSIAESCGVPAAWRWPVDANGAVAEVNGMVTAFCALREIPYGLCIEEWWCYPTKAGRAGLYELGRWVESVAQSISDERGADIEVGGVVRLDNPSHRAMLTHRGYAPVAEVLSKRFSPQVREEVG